MPEDSYRARVASGITTVAQAGTRKTKAGYKWVRKHFVYTITHGKFIQAVMTGSAVAVLDKSFTALGTGISILLVDGPGVSVSTNLIVALLMVGLFAAAFWADHNTEAWRDMVEETTGEESADDDNTTEQQEQQKQEQEQNDSS